jgi:hypothetical protein
MNCISRDPLASAPHCAGDRLPGAPAFAGMSTGRLLDLMEHYEGAGERERVMDVMRRIARCLAHRLGITCDAYIAIMCENSTAQDWRLLTTL